MDDRDSVSERDLALGEQLCLSEIQQETSGLRPRLVTSEQTSPLLEFSGSGINGATTEGQPCWAQPEPAASVTSKIQRVTANGTSTNRSQRVAEPDPGKNSCCLRSQKALFFPHPSRASTYLSHWPHSGSLSSRRHLHFTNSHPTPRTAYAHLFPAVPLAVPLNLCRLDFSTIRRINLSPLHPGSILKTYSPSRKNPNTIFDHQLFRSHYRYLRPSIPRSLFPSVCRQPVVVRILKYPTRIYICHLGPLHPFYHSTSEYTYAELYPYPLSTVHYQHLNNLSLSTTISESANPSLTTIPSSPPTHNKSTPLMPLAISQSQSPTVRIQKSRPTPTPSSSQTPMLVQTALVGGWNDGYNSPGGYLSALPKNFHDQRFHKRDSSGSSVTSVGPPSPLSHNTIYPHIVATSDSSFQPSYDFDYSQTPQTAKSDSAMMYPSNFGPIDMRRIQSTGADERVSYAMSAPQSVSTMSHNSPATPHTTYEPEYDVKNDYGEKNSAVTDMLEYLRFDSGYTHAYQQSLQDVFPDQQYANQMAYPQAQQNMQRLAVNSHRQNMMADRLQAASQDHLRTNSPTSNPRDRSPFRQDSPYSMPAPTHRPQPTLQKQRTSISPKELMLDEHDIEDHVAPLFAPEQSQSMFANRRTPSNLSSFYTAANEPSMQIPQQYPFVSQSSRQSIQAGMQDATPEFPAHMISMESTADEASEPSGSQQSMQRARPQPQMQAAAPQPQQTQRPVDTSSDSGTYSCTYHGCNMRFDTPAKLQKHKREGHRQASPSAEPNLALRNSQAGPHRCDRINPSTGKSCNSIFSRPYDLTRHEDTIHNARKMKVRCHLCTEEKTFSRNDALTRHMRVVHPDVDWVGKQKRKSQKWAEALGMIPKIAGEWVSHHRRVGEQICFRFAENPNHQQWLFERSRLDPANRHITVHTAIAYIVCFRNMHQHGKEKKMPLAS